MLLPFIAWAITGVFFFIKPGYSEAYEKLPVTTYPTISHFTSAEGNKWSEIRLIHSIVGEHLLVKNENNQWVHLNSATMLPIDKPSEYQVKLLIKDAIKNNVERYGELVNIDGLIASTSTNVTITLNWDTMTLHQKGLDTEFIQTMYRIHYLKWTGIKLVDNVLGVIGLVLVILLAVLGIILSFKRSTTLSNVPKK